MKRIFLAVLGLCVAAPAWSLSCLAPDAVRTFEFARDSEAGFWIVKGQIVVDGPVAMPKPDADGRFADDATASTPARFVGQGLRPNSQFADFDRDITLTVVCLAHWCGTPVLDAPVFAAIEVKDSGPMLQIDPCSSRVVPFSEEGEERLLRCARDGVCESN